jgi:peptide/nickel transport system permease protein
MVILLLALTLAVFVLFNLIPGDPARLACGKSCSPQVLDAIRHRLEYDLPMWEQYFRFLKGIFFGRVYGDNPTTQLVCAAPCLGYSYLRHESVLGLIGRSFPITFWLTLGGFIVWIVTGLIAGIYAALRRGRWQDRSLMGIALVGYSMPSFFIGLILITFVVLEWHWLPFPKFAPPEQNPARFFQTMLLPWIVIAVLNAAFYVRLTRNQVLETFSEDYVRTARAKGLFERVVVLKHAMRNALTPVITVGALELGELLSGAVLTEQIFSIPGFGKLIVDSVFNRDYAVVQGVVLVTATVYITLNLLADIAYVLVNPRLRG